uniref:Hexosyltransferase n=1 Tax=Coccolithus braarudii TaxID=221442 RepID=A0A7S0LEY9_9EUKA|mmetsp:Transcript_3693/g.7904  ORF Transcript_3693/g.7904 Transcript_3693/m.7904 type:complete len:372 (+) Transcript_3693:29-1144(+)
MSDGHRCQGSTAPLRIAVGVMSRPDHAPQRAAVRKTWGHQQPDDLLVCFIVGRQLKRTPLAPWAPAGKLALEAQAGPKARGELTALPLIDSLSRESTEFGDVLLLNGSAEIDSGGTSGLKTWPWWVHASTRLPNAEWVAKADDDTLLNIPALLTLLPRPAPPLALLGTIKWGCYSARRFKHERSHAAGVCGQSAFARSQHPGEASGMASTYEGPYEFAYGWFYAMPHSLTARLAACNYAANFHERALRAPSEPFFRKEDDPMNGHWLHKCLAQTSERVLPLRSLSMKEAHNMACISRQGLYRQPSNASVIVHFLKHPQALEYVDAVLRFQRSGRPLPSTTQQCCTRMVWPQSKLSQRLPASACSELLASSP